MLLWLTFSHATLVIAFITTFLSVFIISPLTSTGLPDLSEPEVCFVRSGQEQTCVKYKAATKLY